MGNKLFIAALRDLKKPPLSSPPYFRTILGYCTLTEFELYKYCSPASKGSTTEYVPLDC